MSGKASGKNSFWVWWLPKNTNNASAAFEFIAWLSGATAEKKMILKNQQICAITSLSEDPEALRMAPFLPVIMQEPASGKVNPVSKILRKPREALVVGLSEIASKDVDPATVMQRIQNQLAGVDFSS